MDDPHQNSPQKTKCVRGDESRYPPPQGATRTDDEGSRPTKKGARKGFSGFLIFNFAREDLHPLICS